MPSPRSPRFLSTQSLLAVVAGAGALLAAGVVLFVVAGSPEASSSTEPASRAEDRPAVKSTGNAVVVNQAASLPAPGETPSSRTGAVSPRPLAAFSMAAAPAPVVAGARASLAPAAMVSSAVPPAAARGLTSSGPSRVEDSPAGWGRGERSGLGAGSAPRASSLGAGMASVATSAPDGVGPSALPEDAVITAPDRTTGIPAAFADPAPSLALTPAQREQLAQIQDDFVRQIGGTQRDPADPAYGAAWRDAQWLADQRFRAIFGNEAFLQQQRAANLQASHAAENP